MGAPVAVPAWADAIARLVITASIDSSSPHRAAEVLRERLGPCVEALLAARGALEYAAAHQPETEFRSSTLPVLDQVNGALARLRGEKETHV